MVEWAKSELRFNLPKPESKIEGKGQKKRRGEKRKKSERKKEQKQTFLSAQLRRSHSHESLAVDRQFENLQLNRKEERNTKRM